MNPEIKDFLNKLAVYSANSPLDVEHSFGNYDDVFEDGMSEAERIIGLKAKELLEKYK